MEKQCRNCEFNFDGICAGHDNIYNYGETITDDTKCCDSWSESIEYFSNNIATAPRFLRDENISFRISYSEFSKKVEDFRDGKSVPISIFDAVKYVYGISMVDIAVVLGVTYGVVYRAKTKGFAKKRITQFANGLCVPEKFLFNISTNDFEELSRCRDEFFSKPNVAELLESMPDWKMKLAAEISSFYVHCPIHIAKSIARVDCLYWNKSFSMEGYTESEKVFINYIMKHKAVHNLEYFLDISCNPHMRTSGMQKYETDS